MKIKFNGCHQEIEDGVSLESLLIARGIHLQSPGIAVACNERIISRQEWQKYSLTESDRIEVVHAVQGG